MDLLEKKERLFPCGEDFNTDCNEPLEFSDIPDSKAPVKISNENNEPNRKEIIRNLMREGLIFFKQNTRLEEELKSAKKAEADLRLKLAEKSHECQRLKQKVALLEHALQAQGK